MVSATQLEHRKMHDEKVIVDAMTRISPKDSNIRRDNVLKNGGFHERRLLLTIHGLELRKKKEEPIELRNPREVW